jgi:hypothetical protein
MCPAGELPEPGTGSVRPSARSGTQIQRMPRRWPRLGQLACFRAAAGASSSGRSPAPAWRMRRGRIRCSHAAGGLGSATISRSLTSRSSRWSSLPTRSETGRSVTCVTGSPSSGSPFKEHFVVDLSLPLLASATRHHRRDAARGSRNVTVDVVADPLSFLEEWTLVYADLVERHRIDGPAAFSRTSLARSTFGTRCCSSMRCGVATTRTPRIG